MSYYHPNFDPRKKFCDVYLPEPKEEVFDIVDRLHELVDRVIMPLRLELDGGFGHDQEVANKAIDTCMQAIADFGWQRSILPEEVGGVGGVMKSSVTYAMLFEELARGDAGLAVEIGVLHWFFSPMKWAGRLDLIETFGKPLLDGKHHRATTSITEAFGGVNIDDVTQHGRTLRTIAKLDGDEWVINGAKIWPSGAGLSDIGYMTICTTDPNLGEDGVKFIAVPVDAKGLSFGKPINKYGMCCTDTNAEIFYDNVRVPVEYDVTWGTDVTAGQLLKMLQTVDRISTPALSNGVLQACLEIVLEFTKERIIAGKPMREHSLYVHTLGGMIAQLTAGRSAYMEACYMSDHPETYGMPWDTFQYSRSSAVDQSVLMGVRALLPTIIDMMGSYGIATEYHVEKYVRDLKLAELYVGGRFRCQMDVMHDYYDYDWNVPKWEPATV
jgi:alkylation response protein AidB-like acyl-CoA dehydrogenase